ncbi:ATP-binding protein [Paracoccus sp. DMF]|uniref:sensor histidine kinase n=1 Tax=Paracoccus sp. DMF TaxID=400837 RepID=UPI0021E36D85|nr:ATP-binding protein [Paracoccus sp. DMF]MCV2448828.1 cache domain-containing protein [Paracoccus sp. DMF]
MAEATRRWRHSVRYRLLAIALLPVLVILPVFLGITMHQWSLKFDRLLTAKVNSDLTIAQQYLQNILETAGERIEMLARSEEFAHSADLPGLLDVYRVRLGLDYLYLVSPAGGMVAASPRGAHPLHGPGPAPARGARNLIEVLDQAELHAISPGLAARAEIVMVDATGQKPQQTETRGMVVQSIVAASQPGTGAPAIMVGGILLNRNLSVIDRINELIYRPDTLPPGAHATVSLFLGDMRISTNVTVAGGARALGTRASAIVRDRVLGQGQVWLARAQVLQDRYISAYAPVKDSARQRIGMIYVGILERPFAEAKRRTVLLVLAAFLLVALVTVPVFLRWAGSIFRPLEKIAETFARLRGGDLSARTGVTRGADEIAGLAMLLDRLLAQLQDRDRQLCAWNDALNLRVEERTAALRQAVRELEAATHQLVQSEKLAALGEISAGIAHEINNPLAVIQGNLDVLREILGPAAQPAETELRLIDEQIHRISQIVTRLLDFARMDEPGEGEPATDPMQAVAECEPLVRHMLARGTVAMRHDLRSTQRVRIGRVALQQVLVNLIANAIHAMPEGGEIRIASRDAAFDGAPGVTLELSDTGTGIPPEILGQIFEPFVTSRGRKGGTGLGLSICRRLVERQGGSITVESDATGSRFRIWLPAA